MSDSHVKIYSDKGANTMSKLTLRTKLCDILDIDYPILSAGMGPGLVGEKPEQPLNRLRCI